MAHKQDPPVSMSRQCLATKHWLVKPGYFRVRDMQNAKACVRMAKKNKTQAPHAAGQNIHCAIPSVTSPMLEGLHSRSTTPKVDDGSILTMENGLPCSCNLLILQDIENMANCWQKGWVEKSEHLWDGAYEKLLEEVKFFEVKVANSKNK
ncbi:uncharacterized protein BJ212DRAFT_1303823 [Suillus subaureus]|uniref:Uncharacterized protein n=1 Tax=Suillus subaureus TaxID=48587 RepID=A0A9P7DY22_9AGAM|nr:uncharacterized protein BJ212DRAFT_1303823 [Suillus subaureus]KAG1805956.1 hypothetical protein BJ212DRAFT_1303823 [Suillus subaureus]